MIPLTGNELYDKYNVMILNHPFDKPCTVWCSCGHHIKDHYGQGSDGYCKICEPEKERLNKKFVNNEIFEKGEVELYFSVCSHCHNFYPSTEKIEYEYVEGKDEEILLLKRKIKEKDRLLNSIYYKLRKYSENPFIGIFLKNLLKYVENLREEIK